MFQNTLQFIKKSRKFLVWGRQNERSDYLIRKSFCKSLPNSEILSIVLEWKLTFGVGWHIGPGGLIPINMEDGMEGMTPMFVVQGTILSAVTKFSTDAE